jgi:hypothetical protein
MKIKIDRINDEEWRFSGSDKQVDSLSDLLDQIHTDESSTYSSCVGEEDQGLFSEFLGRALSNGYRKYPCIDQGLVGGVAMIDVIIAPLSKPEEIFTGVDIFG